MKKERDSNSFVPYQKPDKLLKKHMSMSPNINEKHVTNF